MNKKYIVGIVVLLVFLTIAMTMFQVKQVNIDDSLKYGSMVCIYKNNELIQCSHNTLTNDGKNAIKDYLGSGGTTNPFDVIAVANNTPEGNHDPTDTTLDNRTTCCGLEIADGTFTSIGTGNWSIYKVFTATDTVNEVNATGLYNITTPGTYLAYNTFSAVNLLNNDQLNVTWIIWVT